MNILGMLGIAGLGLAHLGLGLVLLVTGWRALQGEILPKLRTGGRGPADWLLSIGGGVGWTVLVAAFCFLVAGRTMLMVFG